MVLGPGPDGAHRVRPARDLSDQHPKCLTLAHDVAALVPAKHPTVLGHVAREEAIRGVLRRGRRRSGRRGFAAMTGRHGEPDTESERDRAATEPHGVELVGVAEATAVDGVDEVAVVDGGRVVTVVT